MSSLEDDKARISHEDIGQVKVTGEGGEFVILNGTRYYKHELMTAFGGTMQSERYAKPQSPQYGNAAAVGLSAFATSAFVLGLYLAGAQGIVTPNVAVSLCYFYGGVVQGFAGMWELFLGNCFAGTVLCSFGFGFWMSFGAINTPAFGIIEAYGDDIVQLNNAIGFYLCGWGIFSFLMLLCTLKSTVFFMGLFFTLDIGFWLLAGYYFTGNTKLLQSGGVFVVLAAMCGWYCCFAGVASKHNSYIRAHPLLLPIFGKN